MSERQRARRDKRPSNPPPIRLTERDVAILQAVHACRVLTTQQLQTLFFPSMHQAYARLAALYHHALLDRRLVGAHIDRMNTPLLYGLGRRGAEVLRARLGVEVGWQRLPVDAQFLMHTVAINTVRVAVMQACEMAEVALLQWDGEPEIKADYDYVTIRTAAGRMKRVSLIPDGYFVLQTPKGKTHFCLELDRGTMTVGRFRQKVAAYQAHYASGDYERRYGTRSLRVLTVTESEARAQNLHRATEDAGGDARFWFTTLAQIVPETVFAAKIWSVAGKPTERQFTLL